MRTHPAAAMATLLLAVAACSGAPTPTGPAGTGSSTTGSPAGTSIDLSQLDVCALVGDDLAATLTGEIGFVTDSSAHSSEASCFWGVPRAGVPQYLEVRVSRRKSVADYDLVVNGVTCPGLAVSGVGTEAKGGVCTGAQEKVWLIAMQNGIAVEVIVNEPKGALAPADLAAAVNAVVAGLD